MSHHMVSSKLRECLEHSMVARSGSELIAQIKGMSHHCTRTQNLLKTYDLGKCSKRELETASSSLGPQQKCFLLAGNT